MKARIGRALSKATKKAGDAINRTLWWEYENRVQWFVDVTLVPKYASVKVRKANWKARIHPKKGRW